MNQSTASISGSWVKVHKLVFVADVSTIESLLLDKCIWHKVNKVSAADSRFIFAFDNLLWFGSFLATVIVYSINDLWVDQGSLITHYVVHWYKAGL